MRRKIQFNASEEVELKNPSMYKVIMHNDDYTPMDFVVMLLIKIFLKTEKDAQMLMMETHKKGMSIIGVYSLDMALTKKMLVEKMAEESTYPLKITVEEEI